MRDVLSTGLTALGASALLAGCGASAPSFQAHRYYHPHHDYVVRYEAGSDTQPQMLSEDWVVDNYYRDSSGALVPRVGPDYEGTVTYDADGDGRAESTENDVPLYDLRLVHQRHDSVIWLSSFPVSDRLSRTELRILAQRYVESVSGAGYVLIQIGDQGSAGTERRYATRIVEEGDTVVDGEPAYAVTFEVANVDQLELDSSSRRSRVRIVFLRPGFAWTRRGSNGSVRHFPVVVAIGYRAMPEYFDSGLPDFERFLTQIDLGPTLDVIASHRDAFFRCWDEKMKAPREAVAVEIDADAEGRVAEVRVHTGRSSTRSLALGGCFEDRLSAVRLPRAGRTTRLLFDPNPRPPAPPPVAVTAQAEPAPAPSPAPAVAAPETEPLPSTPAAGASPAPTPAVVP